MEDFTEHIESYRWKRPKAVADDISNNLLQQGKTVTPRLLLFIFLIEYALYAYLEIVLPEELIPKDDLFRAFVGCFLLAAGICLLQYLILPLIIRWFQGSYFINDRSISTSCAEQSKRFRFWKHIESYWIEESDQFPGLVSITIKNLSE